jgi:hypothetical protein
MFINTGSSGLHWRRHGTGAEELACLQHLRSFCDTGTAMVDGWWGGEVDEGLGYLSKISSRRKATLIFSLVDSCLQCIRHEENAHSCDSSPLHNEQCI